MDQRLCLIMGSYCEVSPNWYTYYYFWMNCFQAIVLVVMATIFIFICVCFLIGIKNKNEQLFKHAWCLYNMLLVCFNSNLMSDFILEFRFSSAWSKSYENVVYTWDMTGFTKYSILYSNERKWWTVTVPL